MQRGKLGLAIASAAAVAFISAGASGQVVWTDDMEAYAPGSGILGQGGWTAWGDDPLWDSFVTDAQANSGTNSLDVVGDSDSVYRFDVNHGDIVSGQWVVSTHVFIPTGSSGANGSYFILLNSYDGASDLNWSTQVNIDAENSVFADTGPGGATLPMIFDRWVPLRVMIDLDNDTQDFYVGDDLLYSDAWTGHISGGGDLELEAMDLFAFGATSVYYDDFQLEQAQSNDDCLTMEVSDLVGGEHGSWTVTGLEPDDRFVVVWGVRLGSTYVERKGYCATFGIKGINRKRIVGEGQADGDGVGYYEREIPKGRTGYVIYTQAAKRFTCPDECVSNIVESTLQ